MEGVDADIRPVFRQCRGKSRPHVARSYRDACDDSADIQTFSLNGSADFQRPVLVNDIEDVCIGIDLSRSVGEDSVDVESVERSPHPS